MRLCPCVRPLISRVVSVAKPNRPRAKPRRRRPRAKRERLTRPVALVGLMGAGKTTVGRRLADALNVDFVDADDEIEKAAGCSVAEIFETMGEQAFRDGERRVIARLLHDKPMVLATGGGAFMDADTRALIKERAISVWLKAELGVLMKRVLRRDTRPLLRTPDPEAVMRQLMDARYPIYAEADLTVNSDDAPHDKLVREIARSVHVHQRSLSAPTPATDADAPPAESKP